MADFGTVGVDGSMHTSSGSFLSVDYHNAVNAGTAEFIRPVPAYNPTFGGLIKQVGFGDSNYDACPTRTLKTISLLDGGTIRVNVSKSLVQGYSAPPSILIRSQNFYRLRIALVAGTRRVSVRVKQTSNGDLRPAIIVRANVDCGVNADITAVASESTDWVVIGPAVISPTSNGAVWVELHNRAAGFNDCYFDSISVT